MESWGVVLNNSKFVFILCRALNYFCRPKLGGEGVLRIMDFGSSHGGATAHGLLVPDERCTAYCRPPERWLGSDESTAAGDLWAIGVHAWLLSTGEIHICTCKTYICEYLKDAWRFCLRIRVMIL